MNMTRRQQWLGIVAIVVVALLAGDRLLLSPLWGIWKARATRLGDLRKSVSQGAQLLEREDRLRAQWSSMRTNTLSGDESAAGNQMLKAFDRWSQESRIGISAIKPQKRTGEDYETVECRVDAFGSLAALTRFLYEIERDPLGLKVEVVEVAARDTAGETLTLGLQVSGLYLNSSAAP